MVFYLSLDITAIVEYYPRLLDRRSIRWKEAAWPLFEAELGGLE